MDKREAEKLIREIHNLRLEIKRIADVLQMSNGYEREDIVDYIARQGGVLDE